MTFYFGMFKVADRASLVWDDVLGVFYEDCDLEYQ